MNSAWVLLGMAALGIDYGWQPVAGGGIEYIIQIEPHTLDSLRDGADIVSDLPPHLRGIRRYRITVGTDPLPHEGQPPPVSEVEGPLLSMPQRGAPSATAAAAAGEATAARSDSDPTLTKGPPRPFIPQADTDVVPVAALDPVAPPTAAPNEVYRVADAGGTSARTGEAGTAGSDSPRGGVLAWQLGMFVSVGANVYLAWLAWGQRNRFRAVLAQRGIAAT